MFILVWIFIFYFLNYLWIHLFLQTPVTFFHENVSTEVSRILFLIKTLGYFLVKKQGLWIHYDRDGGFFRKI
jgi:hypothetical protein